MPTIKFKIRGNLRGSYQHVIVSLSFTIYSQIREYGITSERPSAAAQGAGAYCAVHKCYTTTEFVLLGLGAVIGGVMVGVIGISWFKYSVS